ncbi:hypothetical protein FGM00_12220 [Aggregatimonas sangjinii]|uniref:Uncharacterized protein n=1 Tax=Aggregatimonas sangjinii TaxID=2583587 RepID=A0A5B7SQK7_9FLAO|nr:hypothetical protein FGM00_12220 [Aggregatimonas sangjinii]
MTSFYIILFILLGANAIFLFFGVNGISRKVSKTKEEASDSSASKVYPIDLASSEFKKAV